MPRRRHYYGLNHLHYLAASTYRRARLFDSDRFRHHFVKTLGELRSRLNFRILGYVLMPEHFHLLIWPSSANPSRIVQSLKERSALFIIRSLRENRRFPVKRGLAASQDQWP